jgi:hypothetical protein
MITRLLPENVTENWEIVKFAIKGSLPPFAKDSPDKMNRILESIVLGHLEVWVFYVPTPPSIHIKSIVTTSIITDQESQTKNLLIYSIYNFDRGSIEEWEEGLSGLREYARANGCAGITGFTVDPHLIKFVEHAGGSSDVRFVKIPV